MDLNPFSAEDNSYSPDPEAAMPRAVMLVSATTLAVLLKEVDQPTPQNNGIFKLMTNLIGLVERSAKVKLSIGGDPCRTHTSL